MGRRSGQGVIEVASLEILDRLGALPGTEGVKSAAVLGELDRTLGLGPRYGYSVICDLAQWWTVSLRLVDMVGNAGSPDSPPAGPAYTEVRLTPAGALALAAEREEGPPVPIGLVNGNTYCGGLRPPFDRVGLFRALTRIRQQPAPDRELVGLLGPPAFPTGCEVSGQVDLLAEGKPAVLHLSARTTSRSEGASSVIEISKLPPGVGPWDLSARLAAVATPQSWSEREPDLAARTRLQLHDLRIEGDDANVRLIAIPDDGVGVDDLEQRLREVSGVAIDLQTRLDAPVASVLRAWVAAFGPDEVDVGLVALGALIS